MTGNAATVIVGLSCDYHDAAAAVLVDGELVSAAEQERYSRRKHDASLPVDALADCLRLAGVTARDVDHIVFYEKPLPALARYWATRQRLGPRGAIGFTRTAPDAVGRSPLIGARVARMFRRLGARDVPPLQFIEHHRSHAAAAFLASPFEHAAILTLDGLGEWATATIGVGSHRQVRLLCEQRFPNSIGLVYAYITAYCGFRPNEDEYKVMGLAPYGTPRYLDALTDLVEVHDDGSVSVDARSFGWFASSPRSTRRFRLAFDGPPRQPGVALTAREADLAASVQRLTEEVLMRMAWSAHRETGESAVCLGGGVALNGVANGRLLREGPFEKVWVQPAPGDAGSAVGAALSYWHESLGMARRVDPCKDRMRGSFLGSSTPRSDDLANELALLGVDHVVLAEEELVREVSSRLDAGDVIGWYRGRAEFGPRALGHRSILADARSSTVRRRLNLEVKGRESFRPFAPAVLAERVEQWFDLSQSSPYMSLVVSVHGVPPVSVSAEELSISERAELPVGPLPACTHVDGTARVQTVSVEDNPELHRLLTEFEALTGCPVLLNTSFNVAGEPIVATVRGALGTAARAGLDLVVIGSCVIYRDALESYGIGSNVDPRVTSSTSPARST